MNSVVLPLLGLLLLFATLVSCANALAAQWCNATVKFRASSASEYMFLQFDSVDFENGPANTTATATLVDLGYVYFDDNGTDFAYKSQDGWGNTAASLQWPSTAFSYIQITPEVPSLVLVPANNTDPSNGDDDANCQQISAGNPVYLHVDLVDVTTNNSYDLFGISLAFTLDSYWIEQPLFPVITGGACDDSIPVTSVLRFQVSYQPGSCVSNLRLPNLDFNMIYSVPASGASLIQWSPKNTTLIATLRRSMERLGNILIVPVQFGAYTATLGLSEPILPGQMLKFVVGVEDETLPVPRLKSIVVSACCKGTASMLLHANQQDWASSISGNLASGIIGDAEVFMVGKRPFASYTTQLAGVVSDYSCTGHQTCSRNRSIDVSIEFEESGPSPVSGQVYLAVLVQSLDSSSNSNNNSAAAVVSSPSVAILQTMVLVALSMFMMIIA
eukprot:TRINITY_DN2559_c0_g2_i1.p1 TRINITY_DN2559_c0_g2~~TRINITY_DN2559_c0_g2_i1.p1  ORF type:complete len:444 (-),score=102.97 TRINITY_DN2559_c0_g2_i1:1086-2417(-)